MIEFINFNLCSRPSAGASENSFSSIFLLISTISLASLQQSRLNITDSRLGVILATYVSNGNKKLTPQCFNFFHSAVKSFSSKTSYHYSQNEYGDISSISSVTINSFAYALCFSILRLIPKCTEYNHDISKKIQSLDSLAYLKS